MDLKDLDDGTLLIAYDWAVRLRDICAKYDLPITFLEKFIDELDLEAGKRLPCK